MNRFRKVFLLLLFAAVFITFESAAAKIAVVDLEKIFPDLFSHLAAAMRKNSIGELWDAPKSRNEMKAAYFALKKFSAM